MQSKFQVLVMRASIELFLWIKFLLVVFALYTSVIASLNFSKSFSGLCIQEAVHYKIY